MRIYYKVNKEQLEQLTEKYINNKEARLILEKQKYQVMWSLRTIEQEIDDAGGTILLLDTGIIETKGFTEELSHKIRDLIIAEIG